MSKVTMSEESLKALRLPELQAKYAEIVGVPTRTPNKAWLVRQILDAAKRRATPAKKKSSAPKTITATKGLSVEELQARHREIIGRPTGSTDVAYLRWRLRQAERGLIRVGSEPRVVLQDPDVPRDVDPVAIDAFLVNQYVPHDLCAFAALLALTVLTLLALLTLARLLG